MSLYADYPYSYAVKNLIASINLCIYSMLNTYCYMLSDLNFVLRRLYGRIKIYKWLRLYDAESVRAYIPSQPHQFIKLNITRPPVKWRVALLMSVNPA